MKVLVYQGQSQDTKNAQVMSAVDLAAADIVLTTYDVLRRDLNFQPQDTEARQLRRKKKYEVGSPLLGLGLWAFASSSLKHCLHALHQR